MFFELDFVNAWAPSFVCRDRWHSGTWGCLCSHWAEIFYSVLSLFWPDTLDSDYGSAICIHRDNPPMWAWSAWAQQKNSESDVWLLTTHNKRGSGYQRPTWKQNYFMSKKWFYETQWKHPGANQYPWGLHIRYVCMNMKTLWIKLFTKGHMLSRIIEHLLVQNCLGNFSFTQDFQSKSI